MHLTKWLLGVALCATTASMTFGQCEQPSIDRRTRGGNVGRFTTFGGSRTNSFNTTFGRVSVASRRQQQLTTALLRRRQLVRLLQQQQQLLTVMRQRQQMLTTLRQQQQLITMRNQAKRMSDLVLRNAILENVARIELSRTARNTANYQTRLRSIIPTQRTLIGVAKRRWGVSWKERLAEETASTRTSQSSRQRTQTQDETTAPIPTAMVSQTAPSGLLPPADEQSDAENQTIRLPYGQ